MIDGSRSRGYRLICDECGDHEVVGFDTFDEAVEYKKDNGWTSFRDDQDEWHDKCPTCQLEDE